MTLPTCQSSEDPRKKTWLIACRCTPGNRCSQAGLMIERLVSQNMNALCERNSREIGEPLSLLSRKQMGWQCSAKLRKHIYCKSSGGESHCIIVLRHGLCNGFFVLNVLLYLQPYRQDHAKSSMCSFV